MSRNPFSFGNPVKDPHRFYGRERALHQITDRLLSSAFESTSVVGERRIGKTSLLKHLANAEVAASLGLDPKKYVLVYVDFQGHVHITPVRFWSRILREIARKLADEDLAAMAKELGRRENIDQFDLEDLFLEIEDRGLKLVLLMDEFEYVTKNENFGLDFFAGLRALAIHYPLSLITATREPLVDLCHSEAIQGSPFFNIFASVVLRPLTPEEAHALVIGVLAESDLNFSEADQEKISEIADGHPIFIQMAGYYLFEGYQQGLSGESLHKHLLENFLLQAKPHFSYQWGHSDKNEKISLLTLLALTSEKKKAPTQKELTKAYPQAGYVLPDLLRRGLVLESDDEHFRLFSPLFGQWLIAEMSAERGKEHNDEAVSKWIEERGGINRNALEKLGASLPRFKQEYWSLLADFAIDASAEIAGALLMHLGGIV